MNQARQKAGLVEQDPSHGIKAKKEGVYPVEVRLRGKFRDAACHCGQKIRVAKAQLDLKLPGYIDGKKIASPHDRMRIVTSQTGRDTRQKC